MHLVYFLHVNTVVPSFYDSLITRNENNKYNHIKKIDNKGTYVSMCMYEH